MAYPVYNPYYQNQPVQQVQQIQTNGFVSVRNEMEARNYPVAYGNSVTFKDENAPYVYTKTMGFSQLETPRFEKYKLVKEEVETPQISVESTQTDKLSDYALKTDLEPILESIEALKEDIKSLQDKKKKKEVKDDE